MTTFIMEAKESYDPASVTALDGATQSAAFALDTNCPACGYDFNNRCLTYLGMLIPSVNTSGSGSYINATGFSLYDGANKVFGPGATISLSESPGTNFSPQVLQKDIDTGVVTAFPTYSASKTVPAQVGSVYPYVSAVGSGYSTASVTVTGGGGTGMQAVAIIDAGGSGAIMDVHITNWGTGYTTAPSFAIVGDGTGATVAHAAYNTPSDGNYRWIGASYPVAPQRGPNGPNLINPRNGDFWVSSQSCELYQYRSAESFAQSIAPYLNATAAAPFNTPVPYPIGIDATWCYALNKPFEAFGQFLALVPAEVQTDETAASSKLAYVIWATAPFVDDKGSRLTFGQDATPYIFSLGETGGVGHPFYWRLTKFEPPVLTAYGSNAAGTMTDLTASLWDTGGPNADGATYGARNYNSQGAQIFSLCRLPATNQLAALLKFPKEASFGDPSDYTNTLFSCLYVTLGVTPTYDYHSAFVTGFMDSDWVSVGSIPATGWAVVDFRETNNYLEQSDYLYTDAEYTERWLVFQCYPVTGSAVDTANGLMDVLVKYSFVSGSPPALLSPPGVLQDSDWSTNYAAYQTAISQQNAVFNSTIIGTGVGFDYNWLPNSFQYVYEDPGLYDPTTNSFWFSGISDPEHSPSGLSANAMFYLDAAFTSRAAYNVGGQPNANFGPISAPFLKLSFGAEPTADRRRAKVSLFYGKMPT